MVLLSFILRWIALQFCEAFSNSKNSILLPDFLLMAWIKSYLHVNTNIDISRLNWNNLGIINYMKILEAKSNSVGLKSL